MTEASRTTRDAPPAQRVVEVPYGVRLAAAWTWRLALIAAGVLGLLYVVSVLQVIVVPVLVAALVSALLRPGVEWLTRHRVPRGLAVAASLVGGLALVVGLLTLVGTQIATGFGNLETQAVAGFREIQTWLAGPPLNLSTDQVNGYLEQAREQVNSNSDQLVAGALSFTSTAGHVVAGFFLAVFATIFFLLDGRGIWTWLLRLLPREARDRVDEASRRGWVTLTAYVRATIIVAFVDAVGIGVGAALLGVPLALPLAALVFLGAFVPIVGAFVSGLVAVLVALVAEGPLVALLMFGVVLLVQQAESHILQPFLLGRAVKVHPLAVILAIATGILLAGIVGALFAVPVIAVLNTVVRYLGGEEGHPEAPDEGDDAPLAPEPVRDEAADPAVPG